MMRLAHKASSRVASNGARTSFQNARRNRTPALTVKCSGLMGGNDVEKVIPDGAKVKVIKPIKVYHIPKVSELNIEGLQGEVQKNCSNFKGKVLSPNLPYVVRFETQIETGPVKFLAHMGADELEVL